MSPVRTDGGDAAGRYCGAPGRHDAGKGKKPCAELSRARTSVQVAGAVVKGLDATGVTLRQKVALPELR